MIPCPKLSDGKCEHAPNGIDSPRVCFFCSKNAGTDWPGPQPTAPVIQAPGTPPSNSPAVPRNPCTGCGRPDPTKPYGSPAAVQAELGGI